MSFFSNESNKILHAVTSVPKGKPVRLCICAVKELVETFSGRDFAFCCALCPFCPPPPRVQPALQAFGTNTLLDVFIIIYGMLDVEYLLFISLVIRVPDDR